MTIDELLENVRQVCATKQSSRSALKPALEDLLLWLTDPANNTDENCRKVDVFVTTKINPDLVHALPKDIQAILFDK